MKTIICFGDSITAGGWPEQFARLLGTHAPGVYTVYNRGIGGNTSTQGFDRWESDIVPLLPGLVIIEFGFNDCSIAPISRVPRVSLEEYKRNLTELHRRAAAADSQAVFVVNHPADSPSSQGNGKPYRENFAPYNPAVREVAAACDAPLIDLPALMDAGNIDAKVFYGHDTLHLNGLEGNKLYAQMIFDGLAAGKLI